MPRLAALVSLLALALVAVPAASADVGTPGPVYTGASAPTADKPQSKLFYHDGSWWGVMYDRSRGGFDIFERRSGSWVSTGVEVDPRDRSYADAKWDGNHLDVVSAGTIATDPGMAVRFSRFEYDGATRTYRRSVGPVTLTSYGVEGAILDRDSFGTLWVTFTHNSTPYVVKTTSDDATWTAPFPVATKKEGKLTPDDMSTIVSYNGRIGVMWGNQNDGSYYFATHVDGQPQDRWQVAKALGGTEMSDDHMNVKSLQNDPAGQVFAAVKTSLDRASDPMIMLLVLDNRGRWHATTIWRVGEGHNTRAQVAIDRARRELYVFSTSPCCNGGTIYMKKTSLDSIAFAPGPGTPVLQSSTDTHINNVSTTKQTVDATSGLALIAGDDATRRYWHTLLPLDGAIAAPDTEITDGPAGAIDATTASFSFISSASAVGFLCSLDGSEFNPCTSPTPYAGLTPGDHVFEAAAVDATGNVDPTPAQRTWTVTSGSAPSLFGDGFESGDFGLWSAVRTGVDGTAVVQSAVTAAGSFAAELTSTATAGSYAFARRDFVPAPTSLTVGGSFRIDSEGLAGGNVPLLRLYDPAGTRLLSLYRPNGATTLWVGHSGANTRTTGHLTTGAWARIEVDVVTAGAGASTLVVRVDGTEVYRTATASLGTAGVGRLQIGNDTKAQPFTLYADGIDVH